MLCLEQKFEKNTVSVEYVGENEQNWSILSRDSAVTITIEISSTLGYCFSQHDVGTTFALIRNFAHWLSHVYFSKWD